MYCRVLEGKAQPGRVAEVLEVVAQQVEKVKKAKGFLFVQVLQGGDEIIAVSSWRTAKDLRAYAESELAQDMLARLSSLLEGVPTVRNFEIKLVVEGMEGIEGFFSHDEGGEG